MSPKLVHHAQLRDGPKMCRRIPCLFTLGYDMFSVFYFRVSRVGLDPIVHRGSRSCFIFV
jgi:hypothetical protein